MVSSGSLLLLRESFGVPSPAKRERGKTRHRYGETSMQFYELLDQVLALLQREGRVSYRALKRQFALDDEYLEDLKAELIDAKRLAVDEDGRVLVWTGETKVARSDDFAVSTQD